MHISVVDPMSAAKASVQRQQANSQEQNARCGWGGVWERSGSGSSENWGRITVVMGVVLRLDGLFHGESENPMMDDGTGVPLYIVKSNHRCSFWARGNQT